MNKDRDRALRHFPRSRSAESTPANINASHITSTTELHIEGELEK